MVLFHCVRSFIYSSWSVLIFIFVMLLFGTSFLMVWILIILVYFIGRGWFVSSGRRLARWRGFFFFPSLSIQKFPLSFLFFRLLLLELLILLNSFNFAQNTVIRIVLSFQNSDHVCVSEFHQLSGMVHLR